LIFKVIGVTENTCSYDDAMSLAETSATIANKLSQYFNNLNHRLHAFKTWSIHTIN